MMAKALNIDKMHRSNQIVKRCTALAHPLRQTVKDRHRHIIAVMFISSIA